MQKIGVYAVKHYQRARLKQGSQERIHLTAVFKQNNIFICKSLELQIPSVEDEFEYIRKIIEKVMLFLYITRHDSFQGKFSL